ncbi:MAG: hypothetical protein R6X11_06215 [Desulfonatronovibrio sp.]
MLCPKKSLSCILTAIIYFLLMAFAGCSSQGNMAGKYRGTQEENSGVYSVMELKDNGEGVWEHEDELVRFRWKVRGDEIWLHTQTGGVIRAPLTDGGFSMELPTAGSFEFVRE